MGESLTQVLVKAYQGLAAAEDVRQYLNQLSSQRETLNVTWQTIEAFKLSLSSFANSTEPDEELLDVLFDSFNYIIENGCSEDSWSNFGFELSNLTIRFLSVLEKTQQFEHFFCKLLTAVSSICNHNTDVWKSVSRQLLNIFINKKFSFAYFQDAVKLYIFILRSIDPSELHNFALKNLDLLKNFSFLIQSVGDFESQSFILEVIFLHILDKKSLAEEFFVAKNKNVAECFGNLTFKKFETDCRFFLNEVNENLGSEKKVFTISCNQFDIGGKRLVPSEDDKCIWLDANFGSRRLSITCAPFFESESVSAGGRCLIFIPEGNLKNYKFQFGQSSGEDCHCLRMFFRDLKSSHPDLTSDDAICTALHSNNSEKSIEDFKNALSSFRIKSGESQEKLIVEVGADKKNEIGESDELFMPVVKQKKVQNKQEDFLKGLAKDKKLQDNVISSSNHKIITSALDLFKDDESKKKPKKSYGISVGGGGITDSFAISRTSEESRTSPVNRNPRVRNIESSDECSPVVNPRLQKTLSSDESSPRRSSRLRNKTEVNYSEEKVLRNTKELKHSDKESSSNEKKGKGQQRKPNKNQLFCSQENASQKFNEGPSPLEKEAPPKKYLENSFARQRKSKGDVQKSPRKEEIKNTSLLDPNGYAYKRWSGGETTSRGQFWLDKLKRINAKNENKTESVYNFSDEESKYFKKKSAPKNRKSSSAPKSKRSSSIKSSIAKIGAHKVEIKKETPKRKTEKKKPDPRPTLKISKAKKTTEKKVKGKPKSKDLAEKLFQDSMDEMEIIESTQQEEMVKEPGKNPKGSKLEKSHKKKESGKVFKETQPKTREKVSKEPEPKILEVSKKSESKVREKVSKELEPNAWEKVSNEPESKIWEKVSKEPESKIQEKISEELEAKIFEKVSEEAEPEFLKEPEPGKNFEEQEPGYFEEPEPEKLFEEQEPEKVFDEDPEITFGDSKPEGNPQEVEGNRFDGIQIPEKNIPIKKGNDEYIIVKEVDLNSAVDPRLPILTVRFSENGKFKFFQTNSRSILEKIQSMEEKENEASIPIENTKQKENEIPIENTKENENPVLTEYKKRPASSSDEIGSSPLFSTKSRVNFPINRNKRFSKKRKSQKRKSTPKKGSSSSDEGSVEPESPPKNVMKSKSPSKIVMKSKSPTQIVGKSPPQVVSKSKKRKFKESSDEEFSEPALSPKTDSTLPFISALKQRNHQKTKLQTDTIVQTINNGMSECLKSINKKKAKGTNEFCSYVEKIIPENSHEDEFEKRFNRLERCVTYFQNGCAVTELYEDMKESVSKARESLKENSSDESSLAEEKKVQTFTTRLEGIIKCQTETELKNQLQTMATKMFNIFSLDM